MSGCSNSQKVCLRNSGVGNYSIHTLYTHTCTGRLVNKLQTGKKKQKKKLLGHVLRPANDEIDFIFYIYWCMCVCVGGGNITKAGFSFTWKIPSREETCDLVFCHPIFVIQLLISYDSY